MRFPNIYLMKQDYKSKAIDYSKFFMDLQSNNFENSILPQEKETEIL